jgi:hypothetical protein
MITSLTEVHVTEGRWASGVELLHGFRLLVTPLGLLHNTPGFCC